MSAIQTITAFRQVIGEVFEKLAIAWPALASVIVRSDGGADINRSPIKIPSSEDQPATKSSGYGTALLRGMALSLPLLLPMAPLIAKRMSSSGFVQHPSVQSAAPGVLGSIAAPSVLNYPSPYPYYATHRRLGVGNPHQILDQINALRQKYDS